jgi:hypothetical protein
MLAAQNILGVPVSQAADIAGARDQPGRGAAPLHRRGARFLGGQAAGALVPGAPAGLVAYRADPFTCPDDQLPGLSPAVTVIAGRIAYQEG